MIYIRVELWPHGFQESAELLGEGTICNVGGDMNTGEYETRLSKFDGFADPARPLVKETWKTGEVKGFPRKKQGAWDLLLRALLDMVGKRLPKELREG